MMLAGTVTLSTRIVHLSFVIVQSALPAEVEKRLADGDDGLRITWKNGFSEEAIGNSAILSICGASTETSGEFT